MPELLDDPTLSEAAEQLTALEAEEAKLTPAPQPESTEGTATTTGDRGAGTEKPEQVQSPESKPDDGTSTEKEPQKPTEQKAPEKKESKYTQAQKSEERKTRTWAEVNAEKDRVRTDAEKLKAERDAFTKERADFEAQKQAASKPKYTPEQVEARAGQYEADAAKLDAQGEYDKALIARHEADKLRKYAAEMRANPPAQAQTPEQKAAADKAASDKLVADQKPWWDKAAQEYPDVLKKGSDVAKALNAIIQPPGREGHDPSKFDKLLSHLVLNTPEGMYYVSRLVNAETSALKVPRLEKDNGDLRATVKKLSEKLAIPMEGAATTHDSKSYGQMTESEQEAALRGELAGQEAAYH